MKMTCSALSIALVLTLAVSPASYADDAQAQKLLDEASELYGKRENAKDLDAAIAKLADAEKQVKNKELKHDILILSSRAIYFKGVRATTSDTKLELFEKGIAQADAAKALLDDYCEGFYYHALNLARWAETKGVMASLGRKDELIEHLNNASSRITRGLEDGETIDGYGPARILGRIFFKLPGFAGGSREKSLQYLKKAHDGAPQNGLNTVYYAETLADKNEGKADALKILEALIKDPSILDPARGPENKDDLEAAKKLQADIQD